MIIETMTFKTEDGQLHETLQKAEAHQAMLVVRKCVEESLHADSDDVLEWMKEHSAQVREFLGWHAPETGA